MKKLFVNLVTLVTLSLTAGACGKRTQVVTGIQVQSSVVNQDVMLSVSADLNLGNMSFPSLSLPILHPRGQTPIGSVELSPILGGKNQIKISVNVSELADVHAVQARLPNGNSVPLIANNPTIVVPLGSGAQLYLTITGSAVALGVALPIKTFDGIGSAVGAINLFPTFVIDKAIGAAGIFTGSKAGQNGFALIVDVTAYVNMQNIFQPQNVALLALAQEEQSSMKLDYSAHIPSKSKEDRINSMIFDLNQKKKRLEIRR